MRDLEQYLPSFKKEKYLRGRSGYNTESESVTIEAIERAIKAEAKLDRLIEGCMRCAGEDDHERFQRLRAEVERLKLMVKSITGGLDEAIETIHYLETENALLRKVEEVGEILWSEAICHRCVARECRGCSAHDFKKAMSEYQSWKEGQNGKQANQRGLKDNAIVAFGKKNTGHTD